MRTEDEFIAGCKRVNPKIFESESIKIRPAILEALLRKAFQAGIQAPRTTDEQKAANLNSIMDKFKKLTGDAQSEIQKAFKDSR